MTQLFTIFLNILAPVFALVLLGYFVGPRLQIDARSISRIAYYILAPSFLFNVFSQATIEASLALRMIFFAIIVTLITGAAGYLVARLMRASPQVTAAIVLTSVFGNVGNFGFPIIEFKFGEEALTEASLYFIVLTIVGFVLGVAAATWNKSGTGGAILSVFKTPAIVAAVPAILVNLFDLSIPLFLDRTVGLLAGALIPIMLVTLGIQLAGVEKFRFDRNVIIASICRLVVGPTVAIVLAAPLVLTGIPRGTGILQAAMPAAVLTSLIAMEHDLLPDFVTTVVLFSTVSSAVTLTVVLAMV